MKRRLARGGAIDFADTIDRIYRRIEAADQEAGYAIFDQLAGRSAAGDCVPQASASTTDSHGSSKLMRWSSARESRRAADRAKVNTTGRRVRARLLVVIIPVLDDAGHDHLPGSMAACAPLSG